MFIVGVALIVALCIPIVALLVDSEIGRGIGQRLQRTPPAPRDAEQLHDLIRRMELLEGDVEVMQQSVVELREENQFLQRLLDPDKRGELPPSQGDA